MKTISNNNRKDNKINVFGVEELTISEMNNIRGGDSTPKLRTRDIDIYDTREQ
jgi:hypothetical protein